MLRSCWRDSSTCFLSLARFCRILCFQGRTISSSPLSFRTPTFLSGWTGTHSYLRNSAWTPLLRSLRLFCCFWALSEEGGWACCQSTRGNCFLLASLRRTVLSPILPLPYCAGISCPAKIAIRFDLIERGALNLRKMADPSLAPPHLLYFMGVIFSWSWAQQGQFLLSPPFLEKPK